MNKRSIKHALFILVMTLCMPLQGGPYSAEASSSAKATADMSKGRQPAAKIAILFSQFMDACAVMFKRETKKPDYFYDGLCKKLGVHPIPLQKAPATKQPERIAIGITWKDIVRTFMKFTNPVTTPTQSKTHSVRPIVVYSFS